MSKHGGCLGLSVGWHHHLRLLHSKVNTGWRHAERGRRGVVEGRTSLVGVSHDINYACLLGLGGIVGRPG